jgi:hypothetical protein
MPNQPKEKKKSIHLIAVLKENMDRIAELSDEMFKKVLVY